MRDTGIATRQEWEDCKERLRERIPSPLYDAFIGPLTIAADRSVGEDIELHVPDRKLLPHIEQSYLPAIRQILREIHFKGQVSLRTGGLRNQMRTQESEETKAERPAPSLRAFTPGSAHESQIPSTGGERELGGEDDLSREDPLKGFYPHPSNQLHSEELKSLSFPGTVALIHGEAGTGKSHLTRGVVEHLLLRGQKARYLTLELLFTEFTTALAEKRMIGWRNTLRGNRLLVVDDFQFMKRSARRTQEELRNLMDEFEKTGHKLVLCSDRPFEEIPLQEDLASRLHLAHRIRLLPPTTAERLTIVEDESSRLSLTLPRETALYLAGRIGGDVRKLKSSLMRIRSARISGQFHPDAPLSPELLDSLLGDLYTSDPSISQEEILDAVCRFFQVEAEGVRGPARDRRYSLARHLTAYLCTELTEQNLSRIALFLGRKDHTSVVHARKRILSLMEEDLFFSRQVHGILTSLQQR